MKKARLFLVVLLIFASVAPALACWVSPEPFEVFSEDGTRVFVFNPGTSGMGNAYAAVYATNDSTLAHSRQVIYTLEELSSFAYESNFYFSSDMNHFARMFNESGLPIFEVFSNGIRTRTMLRSDIIEAYAGIKAETSIGPEYKINWTIESFSPQEAVLTISTEEGNTFLFDLASAEFLTEDIRSDAYGAFSEPFPTPPAELSSELHQEMTNPGVIWIGLLLLITGAFIVVIALLRRRKYTL